MTNTGDTSPQVSSKKTQQTQSSSSDPFQELIEIHHNTPKLINFNSSRWNQLPDEVEVMVHVHCKEHDTNTSFQHTIPSSGPGQEHFSSSSGDVVEQQEQDVSDSHDVQTADENISSDNQATDMRDAVNQHPMLTRAKCGIYKPKVYNSELILEEPSTYDDATKSVNWNSAMLEEYKALLNKGTWTLVEKPVNKNIIDCRWIYKLKKKCRWFNF